MARARTAGLYVHLTALRRCRPVAGLATRCTPAHSRRPLQKDPGLAAPGRLGLFQPRTEDAPLAVAAVDVCGGPAVTRFGSVLIRLRLLGVASVCRQPALTADPCRTQALFLQRRAFLLAPTRVRGYASAAVNDRRIGGCPVCCRACAKVAAAICGMLSGGVRAALRPHLQGAHMRAGLAGRAESAPTGNGAPSAQMWTRATDAEQALTA